MAIPQEGKVRPVLNVSSPVGKSFNDNVADEKKEKIHMSSAREAGYLIMKCGRQAKMSKSDLCDAYKLIPVPLHELRIQGFMWLGKFFVENKQIFGSKSAPSNFDQVNNTFVTLATIMSNTNPSQVIRHLDDVIVVGKASDNSCENFTSTFRDLCQDLNVKLQDDCPKLEKAFSNSTKGKLLGIWFDTNNLTWKLPEDKRVKALISVMGALKAEKLSLLELQVLMGNLNNFGLMCPFLKAFRSNLNACLALAQDSGHANLTAAAKQELGVWFHAIQESAALPIPSEPTLNPPLSHKSFTSDAAGLPDTNDWVKMPGLGVMGLDESGHIMLAFQHLWDTNMITQLTDYKGSRFGNKTEFLELVGVLAPLVLIPNSLKKQHVLFRLDNIAAVHGWENKTVKNDRMSSLIIRCIHLLASYLETYVHLVHVPRKSDWESIVADRLSRGSSTSSSDKLLLQQYQHLSWPPFLKEWLVSPDEDWDLPLHVLNYVKKM